MRSRSRRHAADRRTRSSRFCYLLLPIAVVILFSFNDAERPLQLHLGGLHLRQLDPLGRACPGSSGASMKSLEIGGALDASSRPRSGRCIALALVRYRFRGRGATNMLIFLPMSTPEIVLGASLLTLFLNRQRRRPGFGTILIAHVMFIISYVVVTVKARLIGFDRHLEEAAMDLGANEWATFRKVTLPLLAPAILAAALLGFALSIDDFVITYFNAGPTHDVPALRLGRGARRRAAAGERRRERDLPRRGARDDRQRAVGPPRAPSREPMPRQSRPRSAPTTGGRMTQTVAADLQQLAKDHLWMHFTRMSGYRDSEIPVIVRGDGCYLEDANGKRYLDALAGLFSVNIGYGFGEEIGQAALEQMRELPFYTNWTYAHPRAIELATEVASLAPGDLNRVFFVSGGSEAVESAWKLARQYYLARGQKRLRTFAGSTPERDHDAIAANLATPPPPLQGDHALDGVPRDDARRAVADRDPRDPDAVRAAAPRGAERPQHEPLPAARRRDRGGVHRRPARRARADDRVDGARDRLPRAHGAGAELGRRLHRAGRRTGKACGSSATATTSCSRPTR